jgi:hypothetical protein
VPSALDVNKPEKDEKRAVLLPKGSTVSSNQFLSYFTKNYNFEYYDLYDVIYFVFLNMNSN